MKKTGFRKYFATLIISMTIVGCRPKHEGVPQDLKLNIPPQVAWLVTGRSDKKEGTQIVHSVFVADQTKWRAEVLRKGEYFAVIFDGKEVFNAPKYAAQDPTTYDLRELSIRDSKMFYAASYRGKDKVGPYECYRLAFGPNAEYGEIWVGINDGMPRKRTGVVNGIPTTMLYGDFPNSIQVKQEFFNPANKQILFLQQLKDADWPSAS